MNYFPQCDNMLMYAQSRGAGRTKKEKKMSTKGASYGHPGISRMKSQMRCYVLWLTMERDIEESVTSCRCYALATKSPQEKI